MRVHEVMKTPVHTVPGTMPLDEAGDLMRRHRIHHLLVKDVGRIVGILPDHDLQQALRETAPGQRHVRDVMIPQVATVAAHETVRRAANLLRGQSVDCLAVTQDGELAGIVTVSDLLRLLGKGGERRVKPARADLHYRVPHRKQHRGRSW